MHVKSQLSGIHIIFWMFQAMNGIAVKLMMAHRFWVDCWYSVQQLMIEILCGGSTGWKVVSNNDDYHRSRQRQTFDISVTWMRMSFDQLQ